MSAFAGLCILALKACGLAALLLLLRGAVWLFHMLVVGPAFDPLKRTPGPSGSPFQSHLGEVMDPQQSPDTHDEWRKLYGNTFRFHGFGRHDYRLMTFDFRAISQILTSPVYEKPWQTRSILASFIGRGIISMEGHEHKVQRRILGPAFSGQAIKDLSPILYAKAEDLCDFWDNAVSHDQPSDGQDRPKVDILPGLGRAVFDAIGLAGFDYAFDSLVDETKFEYQAFRQMFNVVDQGINFRDIVQLYLPFLTTLWPSAKTVSLKRCSLDVQTLGCKIVERKRAKVLADESDQKDLLGLLVKASLKSDPAARLSDKDLLDQCTTFLFAGTDSVAIGLAWCLRQLATHPTFQTRLFDELVESQKTRGLDEYESDGSDDSGFVEDPAIRGTHNQAAWIKSLESLPLLDSVVRETLRISPPIHSTIRVATSDDEIMLSEPISVNGRPADSVKIRKGSYIHIPIEGLNFAEDIWGPDSREFNPDRWTKLPETARSMPGIGNVMSFGYGPHSCLGQRFAIAEMKTFLAALVLRFEFAPVEGVTIKKWNTFVTRPFVPGITEPGVSPFQLPLHISKRR